MSKISVSPYIIGVVMISELTYYSTLKLLNYGNPNTSKEELLGEIKITSGLRLFGFSAILLGYFIARNELKL